MVYTSTELLKSIKTMCALTQGQAGMSDNDILMIATNQLKGNITSLIRQLREDYMIYHESIPVISGISDYNLPSRASASTLVNIYLIMAGNSYDLKKIDVRNIPYYTGVSSIPQAFVIYGSKIKLLPSVPSSISGLSIELDYIVSPNSLVLESTCRKVISSTPNSVTLNSIPVLFNNNSSYDIISSNVNSDLLYYDLQVDNITDKTITFTRNDLNISPNEWITLAGTSPVPMIPELYHQLLIEFTALEICKIRRDSVGIADREKTITLLVDQLTKQHTQRVDSKPDIISPKIHFFRGF